MSKKGGGILLHSSYAPMIANGKESRTDVLKKLSVIYRYTIAYYSVVLHVDSRH